MFVSYIDSIQLVVYIKVKHCILQTGVFQVFLAENCLLHRYAPVYTKRLILDVDASICFGVIEVVALVLEDGSLGEDWGGHSRVTEGSQGQGSQGQVRLNRNEC